MLLPISKKSPFLTEYNEVGHGKERGSGELRQVPSDFNAGEKEMHEHTILGIHSENRMEQSAQVQKILTEYGCSIRTRIGLHEVQEGVCALDGVILLELFGDQASCGELYAKLNEIPGVEVQKMVFTHSTV